MASGNRKIPSNAEAVLADCMRLAAAAQAWCARPLPHGGGGSTFAGISFAKCGWRSQANENGLYFFLRIRENLFHVRGYGRNNVAVTVPVFPDAVGSPTVTRG